MQTNLLWTGREYYSLENCVVNVDNHCATIDSVIVGKYEDSLYRVEYNIITNPSWEVTSFELTAQVFDERKSYRYQSDGKGTWTRDGKPSLSKP